ncbi:MAG: raffinose/stachyose/melibiose transport system permease protein [Thermoanaerobacterium sp.]|nr:raffinose/stachyose/melibiose transport system permease protein [Thermoanaerobacterium sp.]
MKKESNANISVFILPTLAIYTLLIIVPIVFSIYYGMTDWDGIGKQTFIGISNFLNIFKDSDFLISFKNTIIVTLISILLQIPIGLVISFLLSRGIRFYKTFRAIYFLPVVIAPIAIGLMFSLIFNGQIGALNSLLKDIGLQSFQKAWLSDPKVVLYAVMTPQVWQFIGLYIIIFIAAIQNIPEEIFESAEIDGASSITIFFRIVIPMLWDVIKISIILCFTGSLKSFDYSWIMTQGGPGVSSSYLGVYMFKSAFINTKFGIGSATAIVILATSLIFTVIFQKIASRDIYE